jgi:hypothetical protein
VLSRRWHAEAELVLCAKYVYHSGMANSVGERLNWNQIKELYDQQRVELIDYDWPEGEPHPRSGIVRCHSSDKGEFYRMSNQDPLPEDSAIVFVGPPRNSSTTALSPSLIRVEPCAK